MEKLEGKILITGGAGTLGRAILKRAHEENWSARFTVYSRDSVKHARVRKMFPDVQFIMGDILNFETLYAAMSGQDIVIHAGAVKIIPDSEYEPRATYRVNVDGSENVAMAAAQLGTPHVLAISTDKACHPANAYGATKYMMEKTWQEFSRYGYPTQYHLVRYGNVLESTASVIEAWKRSIVAGEQCKITDPEMTRFWLSPSQAVQYVLDSLDFESGYIYVPKMPALSIGKLFEYTIGSSQAVKHIPLRPGEKMHETLLTIEECDFAVLENYTDDNPYYIISPTTSPRTESVGAPYTSEFAPELSRKQLEELLKG